MNTPKLRFKEFNDEWEEKKLEDVGEIITGKTPSTKEKKYWNGNIQFITPTDMQGTKYQYVTERTVSKEIKMEFLPIGTILFVCIGATIGKMALTFKEAITNQQINSIKVSNIFNNEYIYYSLLKKVNEIRVLKANTTMPIINKTEFSQIAIKVPKSPQEQQKIENFLSSIDRKIELSEEKLENFREYKKGIMQQIFSQELRFKDENGNDYPEWEEKKLEEIVICLDNMRKPLNENQRNKISGNIPYYGANGIQDYINDYIFNEELILLAEDGGHYEEFRNKPIAQFITGKSWVNNHAHILKGNDSIINKFLFYSLVHKDIRQYINGTSRGKLNKSDMFLIVISLPSLPEQQKIADFLTSIDDKIEHLENELENLKEFKKGLLQQMFV